jgi:hypothetical protein
MALHSKFLMRSMLACVLSIGSTSSAFADDKPAQPALAEAGKDTLSGEVLVILAGSEGSVDPSLESIKALKQPPFNTFKSMKILSRSPITLAGKDSVTVELPNGRRLQLALVERMADGRAKVQVSINKPSQKDYLPLLQVIASAGEPFFVAGQKHQGGTLVIGVRVGERPAAK